MLMMKTGIFTGQLHIKLTNLTILYFSYYNLKLIASKPYTSFYLLQTAFNRASVQTVRAIFNVETGYRLGDDQ